MCGGGDGPGREQHTWTKLPSLPGPGGPWPQPDLCPKRPTGGRATGTCDGLWGPPAPSRPLPPYEFSSLIKTLLMIRLYALCQECCSLIPFLGGHKDEHFRGSETSGSKAPLDPRTCELLGHSRPRLISFGKSRQEGPARQGPREP